MRQVALIFLISIALLAAALEFACLRDPTIPDNAMGLICRRIGIAGWLFFSGCFAYHDVRDMELYWLSVIGFSFVALSSIMRCANRLNMTHHIEGDHDLL